MSIEGIISIGISVLSLSITVIVAIGTSKLKKTVNGHSDVIDNYELKKRK